MTKQKTWFVIGGLLGFTGVAFGAFGAHRLEEQLSSEMLEIYKTGIFYHLIHTTIIIVITFYANSKFLSQHYCS